MIPMTATCLLYQTLRPDYHMPLVSGHVSDQITQKRALTICLVDRTRTTPPACLRDTAINHGLFTSLANDNYPMSDSLFRFRPPAHITEIKTDYLCQY